MNISNLLHYVDHGQFVLPGFARNYTWHPTQVRDLFNSLYRDFPIGGLILWSVDGAATSEPPEALKRCGRVNSIVDGHQRISAIYGVMRGRPTNLLPGVKWSLPPLHFHVGDQTFEFHGAGVVSDPLWIDLTDLFNRGQAGIGHYFEILYKSPTGPTRISDYMPRLSRLCAILNRNLAVEYVPDDASSEEVAQIHLTANGGTVRNHGLSA